MSYYSAYDQDRECQYVGEPLSFQYYISNEGNFASTEGANYETFFEPVVYKGFDAWRDSEAASDDKEVFVYVDLEYYVVKNEEGEFVISVQNMMDFIKEHPLIDVMYIYELASAADDFFADDRGLNFTDAQQNNVRLLNTDKYVFYVNGLRLRVAPLDKVIKYKPTYSFADNDNE